MINGPSQSAVELRPLCSRHRDIPLRDPLNLFFKGLQGAVSTALPAAAGEKHEDKAEGGSMQHRAYNCMTFGGGGSRQEQHPGERKEDMGPW